jgi:hypothetical protein
MMVLAIELGCLNSAAYIPTIEQTIQHVDSSSEFYILIFLTPSLLSKLDTPAKRAGHYKLLQEFISALYVSTTKTEVSCNIIFADWCGYPLENEIWEYSILSIPEGTEFDDVV